MTINDEIINEYWIKSKSGIAKNDVFYEGLIEVMNKARADQKAEDIEKLEKLKANETDCLKYESDKIIKEHIKGELCAYDLAIKVIKRGLTP